MIATKIGYDFVHHGNERRGQREIPQDFSPAAMVRATESALKRLKTNRIDLLQLHNIRMEQVSDDTVWETLEKLRERGLVRYYGIALGPAIELTQAEAVKVFHEQGLPVTLDTLQNWEIGRRAPR